MKIVYNIQILFSIYTDPLTLMSKKDERREVFIHVYSINNIHEIARTYVFQPEWVSRVIGMTLMINCMSYQVSFNFKIFEPENRPEIWNSLYDGVKHKTFSFDFSLVFKFLIFSSNNLYLQLASMNLPPDSVSRTKCLQERSSGIQRPKIQDQKAWEGLDNSVELVQWLVWPFGEACSLGYQKLHWKILL